MSKSFREELIDKITVASKCPVLEGCIACIGHADDILRLISKRQPKAEDLRIPLNSEFRNNYD